MWFFIRDRFERGFCCEVFDGKPTEEQQQWEEIEKLLHVAIDLDGCTEGKLLYTSVLCWVEVRTVMVRRENACV